MEEFEEKLHQDLHQFLLSMKEVDERMPECPDVEGKWEEIAKAYIPDGIREFQDCIGTRNGRSISGWKTCMPTSGTSVAMTAWMNISAKKSFC